MINADNTKEQENAFLFIKENYKRIQENLEQAMVKAGRQDTVRLMAVTKTVPYAYVNYAVSLGIHLLGENKVQEYLQKRAFYTKGAEIHFIGSLQNNKVKYIIDEVSLIHSVDRMKLAIEINKRAMDKQRTAEILVEINIGNELSKSGIPPKELDVFLAQLGELPGIRVRGLMTIPPRTDSQAETRRYFAQMEELFNRYDGLDILSMGMSGDYEEAVMHGATIVRIGSALFGQRQYPM